MRYLILWLALTLCLIESLGQATPIEVVFQVDMSNADEISEVSLVGGSIGGWCTDCNMMTDENGDGIYQITIELLPGGHEYRFANGGTLEVFEPFIGECTTSTPDGAYTNRYLYISGSETNLILPAYCFEQCDLCISPGCTDSNACNYNPESNFDDGSCDYCFCGEGTQWVDSLQACLVTEAALMQACGDGTYWDDALSACVPSACFGDFNGDGMRGTEDLLQFLTVFDTPCPSTVSAFTCGDLVGFDGYDYQTVQIGSQCWFAENLRTSHYANGDEIPGNLSDSEWTSTYSGAQAVYGEGTSSCNGNCDEVQNLEDDGRLYNWYAVDDSRGLCPSGWHVPTDGEWMTLEMELGMSESHAESTGWRGTNQGTQMKSSSSDTPSWNGSNTSGFSALPGGWRHYYYGGFSGEFYYGNWWSASPGGASGAWLRKLNWGDGSVYRNGDNRRYGFSVRCVRDE